MDNLPNEEKIKQLPHSLAGDASAKCTNLCQNVPIKMSHYHLIQCNQLS